LTTNNIIRFVFLISSSISIALFVCNCGGGGGSSDNELNGKYYVNLTWDAPTTNNDGTPIGGLVMYKVYYGTAPRSYTISIDVRHASCQIIDVSTHCKFTVKGLASGTYYFAVIAYDRAGNRSIYSNEISRTILAD
jgi:hypothetical protein